MSIEVTEHNNNFLITKVWPESNSVNTMIIDRKEAQALIRQLILTLTAPPSNEIR